MYVQKNLSVWDCISSTLVGDSDFESWPATRSWARVAVMTDMIEDLSTLHW